MPREPFPLGLSFATILTTGLGLAAAAWGIQWGAAPSTGDALPYAWLYVNVMWMLIWLVLWPALAMRPQPATTPIPPSWQWAAIVLAALPAMLISAFVSGITRDDATRMLALQSAASLFALALIQRHRQFPRATALLAGLMMALTWAGPVAAFLCAQFFPHGPGTWFVASPLLAVAAAATRPASAPLWIPTTLLAAPGLLLLLAFHTHTQEKAPGTEVPRA